MKFASQTVQRAALCLLLATCLPLQRGHGAETNTIELATRTIRQVKEKFAPDDHLAIYDVAIARRGAEFVLAGEVDNPEAKLETARALERVGVSAINEIIVLPSADLGDKTWGISSLSVSNGREETGQKAELGTQILMGHVVRIWKRDGRWFLVQSNDGYLSWVERGCLVRCARAAAESWEHEPLTIVTAMEDQVFEQPNAAAQPVSDIVLGNLLKKAGEQDNWVQVQLPDNRNGFVKKNAVEDYESWKQSRRPGPDVIEQTAKLFLGRPYLWGGNSPKGLDCSGFTKMVFFMNGIDLNRNASHQALQGAPVALDSDLSNLRKGDLLFFGGRGRRAGSEPRVSHVAIYLGNKTFIQSSLRVRLSSLDPASPNYDEQYGRSLVAARRVLK